MEDYVLTLYDENGNPIPIPAIQGVGIKDIHLKEEGENEYIYEIVLDDDAAYTFVVKQGKSPVLTLGIFEENPFEGGRSGVLVTATNADGSVYEQRVYNGSDGRGVPKYTEADEGKFLRIVDGSLAWKSVINGEEVKF